MRGFRDFRRIVNAQMIGITALSLLATLLCQLVGLRSDIPTTLISIALVFPIGFSINAAYRRREEALTYLAGLKSYVVALFYAHRDWLVGDSTGEVARVTPLLHELAETLEDYLAGARANVAQVQQIYAQFSEISRSLTALREAGVSPTETSRVQQYLRGAVFEFERLSTILLYRTPAALRAYSSVFLNTFPILFAPYFAFLAQQDLFLGYFTSILYSLVLVGLENIQEQLESPFDQIGMDDIRLDIAENYGLFLGGVHEAGPVPPPAA